MLHPLWPNSLRPDGLGEGAVNAPWGRIERIFVGGDAEGFGLHFYFDHEAAQASQGAVAEADFPDNRRVIPGNVGGLID